MSDASKERGRRQQKGRLTVLATLAVVQAGQKARRAKKTEKRKAKRDATETIDPGPWRGDHQEGPDAA